MVFHLVDAAYRVATDAHGHALSQLQRAGVHVVQELVARGHVQHFVAGGDAPYLLRPRQLGLRQQVELVQSVHLDAGRQRAHVDTMLVDGGAFTKGSGHLHTLSYLARRKLYDADVGVAVRTERTCASKGLGAVDCRCKFARNACCCCCVT